MIEHRAIHRAVLRALLLIAFAILAAGCIRPASRAPSSPTAPVTRILIERVQVVKGEGIFVSGLGTLPQGDCVRTELLENGQPLDWWPSDICIEPDAGRWEILIPLSQNGAPVELSQDAQYEVHAWWPDRPEEIQTRFPFDLSGPKPPE